MAADDGIEILREFLVECDRRSMFFGQTKRLRKQSHMRFGRTEHRHGQFPILNHDFHACAHMRQKAREIARSFRFRNMDNTASHNVINYIVIQFPSSLKSYCSLRRWA